jgi:spermidine synthase
VVTRRVFGVALLLFGSGLTALVYQVAWLRELRLVFGSSTPATSAVIAIFLGGLGFGSLVLGQRVDAIEKPLLFYGRLELAIAGLAAVSPLLVWLVRLSYIAVGGSTSLGAFFGTLVRLVLSTLVLGLPTFLMGGTLPAATRAIETEEDASRTRVALLYGTNALGAVAGAWLANFVLLERIGTRATLWSACAINIAVGLAATLWGSRLVLHEGEALSAASRAKKKGPTREKTSRRATASALSLRFILVAAGVVGFAFMLMELVWYRMLAPLLGGSTYSFGLILAVALLGIGLGGATYALRSSERVPTMTTLAVTCGIEAAVIALPYALGDFVALLAVFGRSLGAFGFAGYVASWTAVTALVVFPAAFVAGVQFPILIALLGRGREEVGRHVGFAYAANTFGGILGALAGGFGLLPLLSATGTWRFVVFLLAGLALVSAFFGRAQSRFAPRAASWLAAIAGLALVSARGPTAAWRHSPIGAGRVELEKASPNVLTHFLHERRRLLEWQSEGIESSVGLLRTSEGFAFALNGKIDGNSRMDAATQVMGGLLGLALQSKPRHALVIGLGTGSTAGWLAQVPGIEKVDVVELEPAVLEVARACASVNGKAMENPRVRMFLGDAREVLLTRRDKYDLIFSEPSNPYRAGISSLFTREFYTSVRGRLTQQGLFIQWMQAYEVDAQTVRTVYATLSRVFPSVETFRGKRNDLLLVASVQPIAYSAPALRARLATEPFRSAMEKAWRVSGVEGFASHYVARAGLARAIAAAEGDRVNTDDRNRIEFALARSLGSTTLFDGEELRRLARARGEDRLPVGEELYWRLVERNRQATTVAEASIPVREPNADPQDLARAAAYTGFLQGHLETALGAFRAEGRAPDSGTELTMVAEAMVQAGDSAAAEYVQKLAASQATEALSLQARWYWRQGNLQEAAKALETTFQRYREDPWPLPFVMKRSLSVAADIAGRDPSLAPRLYDALAQPFSLRLLEDERVAILLEIGWHVSMEKYSEALSAIEPNVPWERQLLARRAEAYARTRHPLAARANRDLALFEKREPRPFDAGLAAPAQGAR